MQHSNGSSSPKDAPRKRVARACDRCRLKKGKCDGKEQCAKCLSADIMCIYTDRKPPQHKQISPAVGEALQSENLTLKKACVILFKQLLLARQSTLPLLDGVDWSSEKVASGKSGRALNYIISQEARVDNRISCEEITNYESDGASHHDDSPPSQHPSPRSTTTSCDDNPTFWLSPAVGPKYEAAPASTKSRYASSKYPFSQQNNLRGSGNKRHIRTSSNPTTFYNELLVQHANFGPLPPTPPTCAAVDPADYLPTMSWGSHGDDAFFHGVDPYTGATRDNAMTATTTTASPSPQDAWDMNPQFYEYNIPNSSPGMEDTRYEQTNVYAGMQ